MEGYNACKSRLAELTEEYKKVVYLLTNVKGIGYDKVIYENGERQFNFELLKRKDRIEAEMIYISSRITKVNQFLEKLNNEEKALITEHYIENENYEKMAEKHKMTIKKVRKKIEKIIEENEK